MQYLYNFFKAGVLLILCVATISVQAQSKGAYGSRIITGPKGAVILLWGMGQESSKKVSQRFPSKGEAIEIYRAENQSASFKKIATVEFPASAKEMQQRLGGEALQVLLNQLKVKSAEEAYNVLLRSSMDTLGFLAFSLPVLEAMGLAYIDPAWKSGKAFVYRFDKITSGAKLENVYTETANEKPVAYTTRYSLQRHSTTDSSVTGIWQAAAGTAPLFAQVFKRSGNQGRFLPIASVALTYTVKGQTYIQYGEQVAPGSMNAYYICATDWAGNLGPASDTLHSLSVNVNSVASITNLHTTDTLNGILLQWDALPRKAIYSAIQIEKSRQAGSNFVVLDTIPASETKYLDRRILPHVSYYYRVRPLIYKLPGKDLLPAAEAIGIKSNNKTIPAPPAPSGVRTSLAGKSIRISWDQSLALDIFAYYVLRGTSAKNLDVISGPVRDTFYIDSLFPPNSAGQLVYAVQAMALNQAVSDTSLPASIMVRQPVVLPSPGGVQARQGADGIYLQWDHSHFGENDIVGYLIYRRKEGDRYFKPVSSEMVTTPFYTDNMTESGSYEYGITCLDAWGNQSILSPLALVKTANTVLLIPPAQISLRNLALGIAVSWPIPYESNGLQYVVYRKTITEKEFKKIGSVPASQSFVDRAAQKNVLYEYCIAVIAEGREGDKSNSFSIRKQ